VAGPIQREADHNVRSLLGAIARITLMPIEVSDEFLLPVQAHTLRGFANALCGRNRLRRSKECVVADAVVIEPVSASDSLLTGKRTGNFSIFWAASRIRGPTNPIIPGLLS